MKSFLDEICKHCGCTFGSHHGGSNPWPRNYCPGHEGRMDWENGPGTVFGSTGIYKEKKDNQADAPRSFNESFDKCSESKWASGMVQGMSEDENTIL